MSSDNEDLIDPNLIDYEDDEGNDVYDDQELGDEEGNPDGIEDDENEEDFPRGNKKVVNGRPTKRTLAEEDDDDEVSEEEITNEKNDEEEANIVERLRASRITSEKFMDFLSGKGKNGTTLDEENEEDDEAEEEGDETYITKTNLEQLEELNEDKLKEVQEGRGEFLELINECKGSVEDAKEKFMPVLARLKNEKIQMKDGLNYIDAKFNLINMYCANLAFYTLLKIQGKPIKDHPVLKRLIFIKTMVSKLKPVDKKLEYQVNKLLRLANEETLIGESYAKETEAATDDPMALKPRPDTMSKTLTTDEIDVTEDGTVVTSQKKREGKYIAPKLVSTLMEDEAKDRRTVREEDRKNRKYFKNEFIKSLQENYDEAPVEIRDNVTFQEVEDEKEKAKRRYEEENFIRLPTTKDDKRKQKEKMKRIQQGEDFGDLSKIREIGEYFDREKDRKNKALDAKDEFMRKTLASNLAKRRNERLHEGDNEDDFFEGGLDEDDGERKFFGGRKQVKQERGQFQTKRPDHGQREGGFGGQRGGFGGQRGGFGGQRGGFGGQRGGFGGPKRGGSGGFRGKSRGFSRGRGGRKPF